MKPLKDTKIHNPIIQGNYPDASIIRVKDDFYLVHSSFELFPAIPIWHSRDLKHFRQIGNVISKETQGLDLSNVLPSQGVQAATIRYHQGTFYVTSTRIKNAWPSMNYHFIVYAKDPKGPWSKVHYIEQAEGIDSSLFFDDNGTCYFLANRQIPSQEDGNLTEIWISEFDINTFQLKGNKHVLWRGTGGVFPEGPRLFKKDENYYLVIAEGGTLHHHAVTVAIASQVFGPYQGSKRNPILTHRHLHRTYPIQNVGHADLVELQDGSWIGVCLGSRPRGGFYDGHNTQWSFGGYYRNLGRETFIFPVSWPHDNEGPIFSGETGKIETQYALNTPNTYPQKDLPIDFSKASIETKWVTLLRENKDHIQVKHYQVTLTLEQSLEHSMMAIRQTSWQFNLSCHVDVSNLKNEDIFYMVAYLTKNSYIGLKYHQHNVYFVSCYQGNEVNLHTMPFDQSGNLTLTGDDQSYSFGCDDNVFPIDGKKISPDLNDAHTGVLLGFTGTSKSKSIVKIKEFYYKNIKKGK